MTSRPKVEVLAYDDPEQRQKWRAICQSFKDIDINFYPEYSYLFELNGDGKAMCFAYYESEKDLVIYPFLRRPINELAIFKDIPDNIIDITTPYGYGGYLRSSDRVNMDNFYTTFMEYCQQNDIVSEFVRFHPIFNNCSYCPQKVNIQQRNETVVIDLTIDEEALWKNIVPSCRNKIRKSKKYDVQIVEDTTFSHFDTFYSIYCGTMERLGALDYYYFSRSWFDNMLNLLEGNLALFHAYHQDAIVMSGIFLLGEDYIHYYLSGTLSETRHLSANNLMLYEVALWAKARGIKIFHLGGGYQPNDNLFRFKASFSPLRATFNIGRGIHNPEYYQHLTAKRLAIAGASSGDIQFFPEYRLPLHSAFEGYMLTNGVVIIGGSGHARVCLDILFAQGKNILGFSDDNPLLRGSLIHGYPLLGEVNDILPLLGENEPEYILAVGNNDDRKRISAILKEKFRRPPLNAIHPSAVLSPSVTMGHGNFIAPGVIINSDTQLGDYTIINTGATLDHDNLIHDFAQISPGCNIAGNVTIEEGAFLGTGAVVIPGKTVGAWAIVGAGAVVIHDIPPYSTAVGVPARVIKQHGKNREADL